MEEKYYYLSNYGRCRLGQCLCIDPVNPRYGGWAGMGCPDWIPFGGKNMDELMDVAKKYYLAAKEEERKTNDQPNR